MGQSHIPLHVLHLGQEQDRSPRNCQNSTCRTLSPIHQRSASSFALHSICDQCEAIVSRAQSHMQCDKGA